jgi:hypothetical protein
MGVWDIGLYSSDFALDLKPTITTMLKLPLSETEILEHIKKAYSEICENKTDEDYTIFWLVLADQMHKKGISLPKVFEMAIAIIDSVEDIRMCKDLGMLEPELKKREKILQDLKKRLSFPVEKKARKTLKKPQELIFQNGDLFCFPINDKGHCFNPYIKESDRGNWRNDFIQTGWGAGLVSFAGHILDYFACYQVVVCKKGFPTNQKPNKTTLIEEMLWSLNHPGTCSKLHFKRMEIELIDNVDYAEEAIKTQEKFGYDTYMSTVTSNISLANRLWLNAGGMSTLCPIKQDTSKNTSGGFFKRFFSQE